GEETELRFLAQRARRSRREIDARDRDVREARLDVAPLGVELRHAEPGHDLERPGAAIERDAAIARAVRRVQKALVARDMIVRAVHLLGLRLELLDAEHVRVLVGEPREKTLARGGSQAVGVECDDAHWQLWTMGATRPR